MGSDGSIRATTRGWRWVRPFYLEMLHGNCLRLPAHDRATWFARLRRAANQVDDEALRWLLSEDEWRGNLAGSWFAGMTRRDDLAPVIGERLLASKLTYAGQGYCLYFALQGDADAETWLRAYLDTYLDRPDLVYDQGWAVAALRSVSRRRGTDHADLLEPGGRWDTWRQTAFPDRWQSIEEAPVDDLLVLLGHR